MRALLPGQHIQGFGHDHSHAALGAVGVVADHARVDILMRA